MSLAAFLILFLLGFFIGMFYVRTSRRTNSKNLRSAKKVRYISPKSDEPFEFNNEQELDQKRKAS